MIMVRVRDKTLHLNLLFSAIFYSSLTRFCRAQGNPCETFGVCGPFGVCSQQESPICSCLQGFYPRNNQEWSSSNWTSGCARRVPLDCEGNNRTTDGFLKLKMMKLSGYTGMWPGPENQCADRCLRNCSCVAYGYDFNAGCVYWNVSLIGIQKFPSGSASDLNIRVSKSELDQKKGSKKIIIIVVVVGFVIISICAFLSWKWIGKNRGERDAIQLGRVDSSGSVVTSIQDALNHVNLEDVQMFEFAILANATNDFSNANKLGKGGFGTVYKGELVNGREIAVKRLSETSRQGIEEFMNEVGLISKLQHRNLVRLLGCCVEHRETMLVYEYMPNKSLDFFLFDPSQEILDWSKRFNIIQGICRGLLYLHRDSRLKIIHRDLKPSNILLDKDWNAKISDFGMARIFGIKQDHVKTARVVGTYGYMAPEYGMGGKFSEKSDVFSFGVLVLEIAIGRRNTSFRDTDGSLNLLGHVWNLWNEDKVADLIDPRILDPSYREDIMRCIHIGLLCVQQLPMDRPSVSAVLSMLRSEIIELPWPKQSAFAIKSSRSGTGTGTSSSQRSPMSSSSLNYASFTTVDGR